MNYQITHSTRWHLPLLFFLLLSTFISSSNADTTVNKKWQIPTTLANTTLDIPGLTSIASQPHPQKSQPKIITNKNDKAFSIWMQYDSIGNIDANSVDVKYSLWSSYFDGNRWSNPIKIKGHNPSEKTTVPEIIFDDNGDILATWTESTRMDRFRFTQPIVFASRFNTLNLDWDNPIQLTFSDLYTSNLKIISRNNGIVHSVWEARKNNNDGSLYSISLWSSAFNGSSWDNPSQLYESRTLEEYETKANLIFNNYNNDIMSFYVKTNNEPFKMEIFARHFNGNNWSSPQRLSTDMTFLVNAGTAAFNNNGNAIIAWRDIQTEDQGYALQLLASHFNRNSRSWSTPVPIDGGIGGGNDLQIAANPNGNGAVVVWTSNNDLGEAILLANYFNGNSWGTPVLIDSAPWPSGKLSISKVTFDQNNHAHVAWKKLIDDKYYLLNKRFDGNSWSTTASINISTFESTRTPLKGVFESGNTQITIGGDGNAHVLSEDTLRTREREGPDSSYPWKETLTKTIWTSQFKNVRPISIQQAVIYKPYGSLVILLGEGFMEFNGVSPNGNSGFSLVDQDGNIPTALYVWEDNMVGALFEKDPETVTLTTPFNSKEMIPLEKYY